MVEALTAALRSIWQPRILRLVWLPLLGSLLLWMLLALVFWHDLVEALRRLIAYGVQAQWFGESVAHVLSEWVVTAALLFALLPLTYATALFITATIAMPIMTQLVAARDYPQLEWRRGGSFIGSLWNAVWSTIIYLLLWVVTLPLWLFGVPAVVLPVAINGWYNDRLFRYDALADFASRDEYLALTQQFRGTWYGLGVVTALLQLVPVLNLVTPVYSGLGFIHFGLAGLARLRNLPVAPPRFEAPAGR